MYATRCGMWERVEYRALADLVEDKGVVRALDIAAIADELGRIDHNMLRARIVCRPNGTVLVGHGLVAAMRLLGWPRTLCTVIGP